MTCAIRTACPYCGVGCGVLATPDGAGGARIEGGAGDAALLERLEQGVFVDELSPGAV